MIESSMWFVGHLQVRPGVLGREVGTVGEVVEGGLVGAGGGAHSEWGGRVGVGEFG